MTGIGTKQWMKEQIIECSNITMKESEIAGTLNYSTMKQLCKELDVETGETRQECMENIKGKYEFKERDTRRGIWKYFSYSDWIKFYEEITGKQHPIY